ncbi:MAG: hypothetical protein AMJ69_01930 [Gammaproteobacteria bacterium SG8_47]|nr:MAG: hypothetical protein AMJ69_01930 [Gammaproteobacteria bacterium SG8_47]
MSGYELALLGGLALLVWYVWDGMRAKERARTAGRRACERADVQFLDDSVVRDKLRLRRASSGRVELCRNFAFEFTSDGERRYRGHVTLCGGQITDLYMEPYRVSSVESPWAGGG